MTDLHRKTPEEFGLNELNKTNTYLDYTVSEFFVAGVKFGVGYWVTTTGGKDHPFICLLALKPQQGWVVVGSPWIMPNEDLNIGTYSSEATEIKDFMYYLHVMWSDAFVAYLAANGSEVIDMGKLDKILALALSGRLENNTLVFDGAL